MLNQISKLQFDSIRLWYLVQHSLSSYQHLIDYFGSAEQATSTANLQRWANAGVHKNHVQRAQHFQETSEQQKFQKIIDCLQQHCDFICLAEESHYPKQLLPYSDKPPILFGQGPLFNLSQPQIAIVGSRKASSHGLQLSYDFAYYLADKGFFITSGLAQGIDQAAHSAGLKHQRTIAVMATGIEQTYPSQHINLRQQIVDNGGSVITEFLPFTKPLQHNFPRRNRIVSGLSLGVLVAEAALESGSLITAKLAAEQGKQIFAIPGHIYSEHHRGCHQLIREGATLVDHPEQIIEDLALPTQWQVQQQDIQNSVTSEIPSHLHDLYQQLDWVGQDLDQLAIQVHLTPDILTAQLMELELLGLCLQQAGRYSRCRAATAPCFS
ncbi:DNA-processing protein DprA [Acinetobacter sp. MB5]|uniref:DNA-processing protein DprA n=1 Tax=Acinetobacter sp. MB5 TaxID=2069438 RepID=UPI000DD00E50|nr:DNA-processing protein DprA [Acinetobacter sp. MB5]